MMNNAGMTKNESTVPLNKFMVEIKKNYEWNQDLEQPFTGAEETFGVRMDFIMFRVM